MIRIGSTLWQFDDNVRVYRADRSGPVYREHFRSFQVVGETPQSWIVGAGFKMKVSKKDLKQAGRNGYSGHRWFTAEGMEDEIYREENKQRIADEIRSVPAATLRRVDALLHPEREDDILRPMRQEAQT